MIQTFRDDDPAYEAWLDHHPNGYVVNNHGSYQRLHMACCSDLQRTTHNGASKTGATKHCSDNRYELEISFRRANRCAHCFP